MKLIKKIKKKIHHSLLLRVRYAIELRTRAQRCKTLRAIQSPPTRRIVYFAVHLPARIIIYDIIIIKIFRVLHVERCTPVIHFFFIFVRRTL